MDNAEASLILKVDYNICNFPDLCKYKVGEHNFCLAKYLLTTSSILPPEYKYIFNELSLVDGTILYN